MIQPRLYGPSGSFNDNGVKLPKHQNVPKGSPYFYGKQESLLTQESAGGGGRVNNFQAWNFPPWGSPYTNPSTNFGIGPQAVNVTQEVLEAPNKNVFWESPILREPTKDNPLMNVSPLDYDAPPLFSDYVRYETPGYPSKKDLQVRNLVKNSWEDGLIQNSDSLFFEKLNSQRQFISMPVGGVPNKQDEFAQWLYGVNAGYGGVNCKQGSVFMNYGVAYTDDSKSCTGWDVSTPTNQGLLNGNLMSSVFGGGS